MYIFCVCVECAVGYLSLQVRVRLRTVVIMRTILICIMISHAVLAVALLLTTAWRSDAMVHLTSREQFADWDPLLDAFRAPGDEPASFLAVVQSASWCNDTVPPGTVRPSFCVCVSEQALQALDKASGPDRGQAAWPLLSTCLQLRPPWRVRSVWQVQLGIPAVYVLTASAALHFAALYPGAPWFIFLAWLGLMGVCVLATAPLFNFSWTLGIVTLLVVLLWGVRPSVRDVRWGDAAGACFWWAEACAAPVYALYFLMLLYTRDVVAVATGVTIAAAIGTMSLRSFWYTILLRAKPEHLCWRIRFGAWLVVLAGSTFFVALLPPQESQLLSGGGAYIAMELTLGIALAQIPTAPPADALLFQIIASGVRNVAFALMLILDLATPNLI